MQRGHIVNSYKEDSINNEDYRTRVRSINISIHVISANEDFKDSTNTAMLPILALLRTRRRRRWRIVSPLNDHA